MDSLVPPLPPQRLQVLCISALIGCLHTLGGAAIEATGRVHYEVYTQSAYAVMIVVGCIVGARLSGIDGVAYGVLISGIALYIMKAFTLRAATGLPIRRYVGAVIPALTAGALMFAAVWSFRSWAVGPDAPAILARLWVRLGAGVLVGVVSYPLALGLVARKHTKMVLGQGVLLLRGDPITRADVADAGDPSRA
jgi:O-antigen/teichoic acid export membrane protein